MESENTTAPTGLTAPTAPETPAEPNPWETATLPDDPAAPLDAAQKTKLLLSLAQECICEEELYRLMQASVERGKVPIAYDGFEPSGQMHIAQAILKAINVNKMIRAGCHVKLYIADWYALMNNKLGGQLDRIHKCGEYFIEVWRALGMAVDDVEFIWASEEIQKRASEYWPLVFDIGSRNSVQRLTRCCTIMGRKQGEELSGAQILYPCMQCADIFFLKADICQLGMDQRKVNVLAREYCDTPGAKRFGIRFKPVILSHGMLAGLKGGDDKMSKSDPDSAIFCNDPKNEVVRKINKAFCEPGNVDNNPVLAYAKTLVIPRLGSLLVKRSEENGGDIEYKDSDALTTDFKEGRLHPGDLKKAVAEALNTILEPVRKHFETDERARNLARAVKSYRVTK